MKLSKETLLILKNFGAINDNILFKPGNVVVTGSPVGDIYASATVDETFPMEFGIYNLSKFLSAISLFKDSDLLFEDENFVIINGTNGSSLKYVFSEPNTLITPPTEMDDDLPELEETFKLSSVQLDSVLKAASTLGVKDICFISEGDNVSLVAVDLSNPSSDRFSLDIGHSSSIFSINFPVEVLKILPGDYTVGFSRTGISNWVHSSGTVTYWIASSTTSTFED